VFFDFDNDTLLDVAANGHMLDNPAQFRAGASASQRKLFRNAGHAASATSRPRRPCFALEKVGRELGAGEIDNDGDLDSLVTNNGQTLICLQRRPRGHASWLIGRRAPRGIGRGSVLPRLDARQRGESRVELPGAERSRAFGLGDGTRAERLG
jgi:hypothetical protein